jgi:hypothetical protein
MKRLLPGIFPSFLKCYTKNGIMPTLLGSDRKLRCIVMNTDGVYTIEKEYTSYLIEVRKPPQT